ncbi:hypothetical protein [Peristeroidobacter agariperforans]|uniref:hypothetical protein n=1 Tax=Peristeroidobacter agariperforans TaxID=268404 RepID=UPI00101D6DE2|nr:hypothetical protein [Peristeroidobacter agariperforans]
MNTFRISRGPAPLDPRAPRRLIAIGLMSLTLAACGGDGSGSSAGAPSGTTPTGESPSGGSNTDSPSEATALECVRDNYPCSFSEVSLPVIERSLALSDEVAEQLESGVTIEQAAAFLSSQSDIADVTVDGPVLGFRLAGGRPMIVDVSGDQDMLAGAAPASAESPAHKVATAQKLRTVRTAMSSKITGDNKAQRRALVLSPFRYEENFGNAGELIAGEINTVRGYAGNVTYLATTTESAPQVTVDTLTQLENYDVIHIDTHGGTLCKKKDSDAVSSDKKKCADGITDFLVQRFHGTAQDLQSVQHPGVIHYRGRLHQSIAVTADFFRHYYPQGLSDKLFILGACNTFRTDMAEAIAGNSGVYVSWDGYTDETLVRNTGISLVDSLRLGLTVGEAFARMPKFSSDSPEATGVLHRTPRQAGGDLRIRDLISVRDNITGEPVSDASGIEVMETPEDGNNDNLNLEFTVDGITPEQLDNFYLNLKIEDQVIGHINLGEQGVPSGDFSYRVSAAIPLGFDAQELQALEMDFWIPLPDQGEDHFTAAPRVNDREDSQVGREWVLGSRLTESHHDSSTTITADVEFAIDPEDDPASNYHYFYVKSGRVRVQRDYEDAYNCAFHIDHTIDLAANASNNYLVFDTSGSSIVVSGFGTAPTEYLEVTSSCGTTATVNVDYVYFLAEDTIVSGNSAQGVYNDGAVHPTVVEWTLDRTL